jgi:hypothetical protein
MKINKLWTKKFHNINTLPYALKLFVVVFKSRMERASVFVTFNNFHPSLIFVSKASAYPGGAYYQFHNQCIW